MRGRDRIVLFVVVVLVLLGGGWMMVVSPERKKADKLNTTISTAKSELSTAEDELASARAAEGQYPKDYADIVNLGKAVPTSQEVPALIYQLAQASGAKDVEFNSITSGGSGGTSAASSAAATAAAASPTPAAFTPMPFTFIFNGGFFQLEQLFEKLNRSATMTTSGTLQVSGRLLTIQSVKLAPETQTSASSSKPSATGPLDGTITASAYVLPPEHGVAASATPSSPTGAATPASSSGSGSSPTTPAIARVTP